MSDFNLEHFLPYQLAKLASRTSRDFARVYAAEFGLTIPEWRVLAHLGQEGNVSIREIHARVDMDKSKVTRAVQRLEAAGLVQKEQNPDDKRLVSLTLSPKGKSMIQRITPLAKAFADDLLAPLSTAEARVFRGALLKLMDRKTDAV